MIKATLNVDSIYWQTIFGNDDDTNYNHWNEIKKNLYREGIELCTQDIHPPEKSELIIDFNVPQKFTEYGGKRYLIQFECEVVLERNWKPNILNSYTKIFTWNDEYVDNNKYYKMNFPQLNVVEDINCLEFDEKKLCTLIAANKYYPHKNELYSERVKAIKWFEKNHPEKFDFYGHGWDKFCYRGPISKLNYVLNSMYLPSISKFKTYHGSIPSKTEVLSKYKFSICYENAKDISGYITEKIFDCFYAKNVPVYWGAPNVSDHIPEGTFIDRRQFSSYEDLYDCLVNMDKMEYDYYLENIHEFIHSPGYYEFTLWKFVDVISNNIIKDFRKQDIC